MRTAKWKGDSHGKKRRALIAKGRTDGQPKREEKGAKGMTARQLMG